MECGVRSGTEDREMRHSAVGRGWDGRTAAVNAHTTRTSQTTRTEARHDQQHASAPLPRHSALVAPPHTTQTGPVMCTTGGVSSGVVTEGESEWPR